MVLLIPIRTWPETNRRGVTRTAAIIHAKRVRAQRDTTHWAWLAIVWPLPRKPLLPCTVTLTRIAPQPLDKHDALAPSMKAIVDQLAVELGLPVNAKGHAQDSDPRVTWQYAQRKGGVREYAVEVRVVPRGAEELLEIDSRRGRGNE